MKDKAKVIEIAILAIIAVIVISVNFPFPINITATALEVVLDDETYLEERNIRIEGVYHYNILANLHEFKGSVRILEHDITASPLLVNPLHLEQTEDSQRTVSSTLFFESKSHNEPETAFPIPFATIFTTAFFGNFVIMLHENGTNYSVMSAPIIVPNVDTRRDAISMIDFIIYGRNF